MKPYLIGIALCLPACDTAIKTETLAPNPSENITNVQPVIPMDGSIYLNQLGFAPSSTKLAIVQSQSQTPLNWILLDKDGTQRLSGVTTPLGYSARAGQSLHRIDVSHASQAASDYRLRVNGIDSHPFDIRSGLYGPLKYDALAYFYHNRSADPILAKHVGQSHARPAGHPTEIATCFKGTDKWGTDWPGCEYELDVTGGWYDAGDHGKYVVNSGISVWTLLNAYTHFGKAFADGQVNIPEAGNGVNDILDEARTNIEFMLAMQIPKGQSAWAARGAQETDTPLTLVKIEDAGGLVHHKVHSETWPADAVYPHEFTQPRRLYPPSTGATLNVAAIGAICARIWQEIDTGFSKKCWAASQAAYQAAQKYPDIYGYNNFDGGGPYSDNTVRDEFYWAAAEALETSGQTDYQDDLQSISLDNLYTITPDSYADEPLSFAPSFSKTLWLGELTNAVRNTDKITKIAERYLADIADEPLHIPYARDVYKWGSNSEIANRGIILGQAYLLTGEAKYRDGVVHLMDYLLGRNPLGQSYVSGYGEQSYVNPHHRHWSHSLRQGAPIVPAGVLSGGPNNDNMSDPIAKTQIGTCQAQSCWTDHYSAWTQNEVTINWNAPLFWIAAFLDATDSQ